jgi:hypothetical protein
MAVDSAEASCVRSSGALFNFVLNVIAIGKFCYDFSAERKLFHEPPSKADILQVNKKKGND